MSPPKTATWIEFSCIVCGKPFSVISSQLKHREPKYCSQECYHSTKAGRKYAPRGARGGLPKLPPDKRVRPERTCPNCGKSFFPHNDRSTYCSRPCLYAHKKGSNSPYWKGGRHTNDQGYVKAYHPEHPNADRYGYMAEHRYVMEQKIGRVLEKGETVHHINGIKDDNRPENLELHRGPHGNGVCLVCADCGSTNIVSRELTATSGG